MNCCDEYSNCNQGRDCPIRKCPYCHGAGYDASGYACKCQPDEFDGTSAWNLIGVLAVILILVIVKSCV